MRFMPQILTIKTKTAKMNYIQFFWFTSKFAEDWLEGKNVFTEIILKSLFVIF